MIHLKLNIPSVEAQRGCDKPCGRHWARDWDTSDRNLVSILLGLISPRSSATHLQHNHNYTIKMHILYHGNFFFINNNYMYSMELWFERTFFRELFMLRHGFQARNVSKLNLHSPFAGSISNILHGLFPRYLGKYLEFCYDTVRL